MSSSTPARQPAGTPAGGQFAATAHPEAGLTLEQLADLEGCEDPTFDPDDPYGAWMVEDGPAVADDGVPADLSGLDRYELAELRTQVQGRLDVARREMEACAADRMQARDWGDQAWILRLNEAEDAASAAMEAALVDLHRISEASVAGRMSRDDMTPEQRDLFDATFRHAYEYGVARVGGIALETTDEAEEFAAYVTHQLTVNDFDEAGLELNRMLADFEAERAGLLAAHLAETPAEKTWAKRMAQRSGLCVDDVGAGWAGRKEAAALRRFADRLGHEGFYVRSEVTGRGLTFRLTGGRPRPRPEQGAA